MSTEWITVDLVHKAFPTTHLFRLKQVQKLLIDKYPTGNMWLHTPLPLKEPVKAQITDLQHIITWAWERQLFTNPAYSEKIEEYLMSGYFNHMNLTLTNFALNKMLIDEELLGKIDEFSGTNCRKLRKAVILICLFSMKPFSKVTDDDLKKNQFMIDKLSCSGLNCPKFLQDFRLYMGYSSKIKLRRSSTKGNWDKLKERYPRLSKMLDGYRNYLKGGGYSKSVIKGKSIALIKLFDFLEEEKLKDCCGFKLEDFIRYTTWLKNFYDNPSTHHLVITNTKTFFVWGTEIEEFYSFFPRILEFPKKKWTKLNQEALESQYNSQGLSFDKKGLPQAFVKTLIEFEPVNEKEELAKNFMMLLCSVPCRLNYVRTLPMHCLFEMQNAEKIQLLGITSGEPDKAGNVYGQFPLLDKMGLNAIKWLKRRCEEKGFRKIENPKTKKEYVHLFQLEKYPYILSEHAVYKFIDIVCEKMPPEYKDSNVTPHRFRTHILTEITAITRDITVTKTAAGHRDIETTKWYHRSELSKDTLLNSIIEGYEQGEFSGKFYFRLLEALTSDDDSNDKVLKALTTEIQFSEFLRQFGRRREMGYCLCQEECGNYYKCWSCKHFLMRKTEIQSAIKTLSKMLINFKMMMSHSRDFSFDNPIVTSKQKAISLIIKRICQLGITPEQVMEMVENHLNGEEMGEVLKK